MAGDVPRMPVTMAAVVVAMAGEWGVSLLEMNFQPPFTPTVLTAGGAPRWRDTSLITEVVVAATGVGGVEGVGVVAPEVNLGGPGGGVGARDPI